MQTKWLGEQKVLVHNGRYYQDFDTAANAIAEIEWADKVLDMPKVTYVNGRNSLHVASEVRDHAEDVLLDYLLVTG